MLGRIAGAVLGGAIGSEKNQDPVKGAIIGAATMFVARRVLPARVAVLGATIAAGYITRRLARREEAKRLLAQTALTPPATAMAAPEPVQRLPRPRKAATNGTAHPL